MEEKGFEIRNDEFVVLGRISCTGADGNVFETHENIYLRKVKESWERETEDGLKDSWHNCSRLYNAILKTEKETIYHVPSAALFWNILQYLDRLNEILPGPVCVGSEKETLSNIRRNLLLNSSEYKLTNTMIDWKGGKIIHYPGLEDFIDEGYSVGPVNAQFPINQGKRKTFDFDPWTLKDTESLDEWLAYDANRAFLQNVTGINDVDTLIGTLNRLRSVSRERFDKDFAEMKKLGSLEEFKAFNKPEEMLAAVDPIIKFNKAAAPNKSPVCIWRERLAVVIQGNLNLKTYGTIPRLGLPPSHLY